VRRFPPHLLAMVATQDIPSHPADYTAAAMAVAHSFLLLVLFVIFLAFQGRNR